MAAYKKRVSIWRNVRVVVDGIKFDSKAEARRYTELDLLQKAGEIKNLELQPRFELACGDRPIRIRNKHGHPRRTFYTSDFRYVDKSGETIIEDVKGYDTPISRLRRAIVEAQYDIRISIVR